MGVVPKGFYTICVFVFAIVFTGADLPPDFKKCEPSAGPCIARAINELLKKYPEGYSPAGLPPINELKLENLTVSKANPNSPVQLNFKLHTANFYGMEKTNITRIVGFDKNPKNSKFEVAGIIPELQVKGKYECNGKVLLLPVKGLGDSDIRLKNLKFNVKVKVDTEQRADGKNYAFLTQVKSKLQTDRLYVHLENLFDGNKALGDALNRVIDENWRDLWYEIESGINSAVGDIVKMVMSSVLNKLSYDDFFVK